MLTFLGICDVIILIRLISTHMKTKFTIAILFLLSFFSIGHAQEPVGGGEFKFNESKSPCLTEAQRDQVMEQIRNGIGILHAQNRLAYNQEQRGTHPLFSWPIKKADGVPYADVWGISGYVDHNAAYPNQLTDYNCGSHTYDTAAGYNHMGVDIFTWPFPWKMMDNNEVEIIAAAPGQILYTYDGQFDRSCDFNNNFWNTVYVQHADGSVAAYGHMKNGSVTTKSIGEMVEEGEYLGIVGSSGNSTGPHLHFEAYSEVEWNGEGQDVLIDPYAGPCNDFNDDSWWQTQRPYTNPNINAVLTHTTPPEFPTCPTTEITHESDQFDPGQQIYFTLFMRDQAAGTSIDLRLIRPDGTYLYGDAGSGWSHQFTENYTASWWWWTFNTLTMEGEWKWEATYLGQTVTHSFNVGTLGVGEENFSATTVYPNPFKDIVTISSNSTVQKAIVTDILGKKIKTLNNNGSHDGLKEVNLETLSKGVYFLILESDSGQKKTVKLVKE